MCPSFSFGIEVGVWDVIVLIPDHCLSINSVLQCRYMMSVTRSSTMNFLPWRTIVDISRSDETFKAMYCLISGTSVNL